MCISTFQSSQISTFFLVLNCIKKCKLELIAGFVCAIIIIISLSGIDKNTFGFSPQLQESDLIYFLWCFFLCILFLILTSCEVEYPTREDVFPSQGSDLILVLSLLHIFYNLPLICTCCLASIQVNQYAGTLATQSMLQCEEFLPGFHAAGEVV